MSGFSSAWLHLREPFDAAARSLELERLLAGWAVGRHGPLEIVDLGSGTGSNLRHLAPRLDAPQHWRLIEHDPALIHAGTGALVGIETPFTYLEADLNRDLSSLLEGDLDLLTASALIDLVSADWLEGLVDIIRARRCAILIVLSYDGHATMEPAHPMDDEVTALVNIHQREDKGFGPALGPAAARTLASDLETLGGTLTVRDSDWRAGPGDRDFQKELISGWLAAAGAMRPQVQDGLEAWREERVRLIEQGLSRITVGHQDLLWLP